MLLELQSTIIYGPINSRRIGTSLGVNILPADLKVCSFDCLYCQYGWTDFSKMATASFPATGEARDALVSALKSPHPHLDYITFSGNGEPTLHPDFAGMVDIMTGARDDLAPDAGTAILSNSTTVPRPDIRDALSKLDLRIMKLDAGEPGMYESYNRPAPGTSIDEITDGLAALDDVTIQSLFTKGPGGNLTEGNLADWIERLERISPVLVQIYTLDRGFPSRDIEKLDREELESVRFRVQGEGIKAQVF